MDKLNDVIDKAPVILRTANFILKGMPDGKLWLENADGEGTGLDKQKFYDEFNKWLETMFMEWM